MQQRYKQLGKDSLIYGIGGVMAKAFGLFLLPVYTRLFAPAEYGTIEMLTVLNSFLGSILVLGMDAAQSFYFFEQKDEGQKAQARVVTSILQWRITWGSGVVLLATLISPLLNKYFFDGQLSLKYFAIAFAGAFFGQIMSQSAEVFRLLYRPWSYISVTLGQTLGSAAIAIILIVVFQFGLIGFFIGTLVASIVAAMFGWWRVRNYLDFSVWHKGWWPRLIKFGAPLVPAAMAMYVLNTSDRWFVSHFNGQTALGLYAVGAKFSFFLYMAVITFRKAWWPIAMDAMHSSDGPAFFRTLARLYLGLGSASVVLLTAFSPYLLRWFTDISFHSAYPIVGVLAWHSLFYGFHLICVAGIWKKEKTSWAPILMGTAALLNFALNTLLVPKYGGMGAAIATSISFLVWNILTILISERLWAIGYAFRILALEIVIGGVGCFAILKLYEEGSSLWEVAPVPLLSIFVLCGLSVSRSHLKKMATEILRILEKLRKRQWSKLKHYGRDRKKSSIVS